MIEHEEDKLGGLDLERKSNEKFYWTGMKDKLTFRRQKKGCNTIWYTWCNFQQGKGYIVGLTKFMPIGVTSPSIRRRMVPLS